jgi:trans-aconitate methyltransferase
LANRGFSVVGVDVDPGMLSAARTKRPELPWVEADLTDLAHVVDEEFDVALLAGNVLIFVRPGTEGDVLHAVGERVAPGGLLVSGFSIRPDRLSLSNYDDLAEQAGLQPVARWATWNRDPFTGGDYAVSVHRRPAS